MPAAAPAPPLRWWSHGWRYLTALLISLVVLGVMLETIPSYEANAHGLAPLDMLLGLAAFVAMGFRRRWPFAIALGLTAASAVAISVDGPWVVCTASMATHRKWWQMITVGVASVGAESAISALYPDPTEPVWQTLLLTIPTVAAIFAVGAYTGARRDLLASLRDRAETAEREQSARVAQARTAERSAIAREMHDVLAHRISLVAMHAGALVYRDDLTPAQTREAAQTIQATAHAALEDLRGVLGVLRSGAALDAAGVPDRPQPSLADLPDLVAELEATGSRVAVRDERAPGARAPATIERHAYRILQESCTNARKHAPGAPIAIRLAGGPGQELLLEVSNPMPAVPVPATPGAGLGLIGLAERAELIGGRLDHTHTRDDRFRVQAALPWPGEESTA